MVRADPIPSRTVARMRWTLKGQLQGVGFRPFAYRLADQMQLAGFVRNDSSAVVIEAEGLPSDLDAFERRLLVEMPQMARIAERVREKLAATGEQGFRIEASQADQQHRPTITVDSAVCRDCLHELMDPEDSRYGYGLINCTNCGPRYSIIQGMPYDRASTTMQSFGLCEKCHQQFLNPADRRFHAQPVACPACGPRVGIFDFRFSTFDWEGAVAKAAGLLADGRIVAIKGIGGFHLACRADDAAAVRELRARKKRDAKPFALMCASLDVAKRLVELSGQAIAELSSPAAPIILAAVRSSGASRRVSSRAKEGNTAEGGEASRAATACARVADQVAMGNHRLGVMLPYTPIHHLLFAALGEQATTLVMTSANLTDEPLVKDNDEAIARLAGIADAVLLHERDIERSIDDSVVVDMGAGEPVLPIRRARGYVPQVIRISNLRAQVGDGLCVGGELKNTVAIVRGDEVVMSHHLGDLKHTLGYDYFRKAIDDMCRLFELKPQWIAHDLHPTYLSTQWARHLAERWDVPLIGVQHHHAHAAACLAEHKHEGPALAIVCDGVGYGDDGTIWGGELLLVGDLTQEDGFKRLGRLRPMALPGGDAAARDTRRCASAAMWEVGRDIRGMFAEDESPIIAGMLRSGRNCVSSSAAGRLFDAVACLLGVCMENSHEAQAAMALESLAYPHFSARQCADPPVGDYVNTHDGMLTVDLLPYVVDLKRRRERGEDVRKLAWEFHEVFALAWAQAGLAASQKTGVKTVALSGGVFCNEIVTKRISERLVAEGLQVLRHEVVPPNDGGIALGQAAIAAAQISHGILNEKGVTRCA